MKSGQTIMAAHAYAR